MSVEEAQPQPPGIIFSCDFNIDELPADASIFFDDLSSNIIDVQENVNKAGLNLRSVYCPSPPHPDAQRIVWYNTTTHRNGFTFEHQRYSQIKVLDDSFSEPFKEFINGIKTTDNVGPGLTRGMIGGIIAHERITQINKSIFNTLSRLYFFDFDLVLNQINGLNFSFLTTIPDNEDEESLLWQYAKYLFSDCIGASCGVSGRLDNLDRLKLLQIMFSTIGPERIYVITSNRFANIDSQNRPYFIKLLRVLLPSFIETHLVCTHPSNKAPFYNIKSAAIIDILNSVRPKPKPKSVRSPSSIAKHTSKKGGSKRTRNKRRRRCTRRKSWLTS